MTEISRRAGLAVSEPRKSFAALSHLWRFAGGLTLLALASCSGALVTSRPLVDSDSSYYWTRVIDEIPVQVHGSMPGHTASELTALLSGETQSGMTPTAENAGGAPGAVSDRPLEGQRRVILFLNPSSRPLPVLICRNEAAPQSGPQTGNRAGVYAVLCNGTQPVTATQGTLPAIGQTDQDIRRSYSTIQDSIIEAIRAVDQSIRGGE
jgi:hypothetical protein